MVIERENNLFLIRLPARFCGSPVRELLNLGAQVLELESEPNLILDMSETELVDSAGVGMVVSVAKDFKARTGARFSLRNLTLDVEELFVDTGLDKIFDIATESGMQSASVDLFDISAEIRLDIKRESRGDVCLFHLAGVMNHPVGSRYFKQQFLLALADYRKILLDFEELTFFDSLSVGVILTMNELLKKTGGNLRICSANFIVDDLFNTLSINQIIPCLENIESALVDWKDE